MSEPAAATMTTSSTTNGELEKPHVGIFVSVSDPTLRDQRTPASPASSTFRIPVAPKV